MKKAERTRMYLLEKAFNLIYENGYQSASIDKILEGTDVTKGAFYYHFKNKEQMGLAMIQEIIAVNIHQNLIEPLNQEGNKLDVIHTTFKDFMMGITQRQLQLGCPTNNLIHEMAPLNPKFATALLSILNDWNQALTKALEEGIQNGEISVQGDAPSAAEFIITSYEGARGLGKLYNSYEYYGRFLNQLKMYLSKE